MAKYDKIKLEVLNSATSLSEHGYLGRTSSGGNISARFRDEEILAITPSGRHDLSNCDCKIRNPD